VEWPQWHNIIPAPYGEEGEFEILVELCKQGIRSRGWEHKFTDQRYHERLRHELRQIRDQGFVRYFLVVHDLYHNCVIPKGIMYGTGRGSAAGSLVCALLHITDPDPLEHGLIFERFIAPDRVTAPDIDMDFEDGRRHEVKQYIIDKYGEDRVANIGTYSRLKGKAVLKDVSRVYNIPIREVEDVSRFIIERSGGDARASMTVIDTFDEFDVCRRFAERHPEVLPACEVLEGRIRQPGIHAAGVVVTPFPLTDVMPIERRGGEGKLTVAFEGGEIDELGFLKLDVLGLKTLAVIKDALTMVGLERDDLVALDYADPKVLDAFHRGDTMGVFQFTSDGLTKLLQDMPIEGFEDLVALCALYRPGGMRSGICNDFVARRKGAQKVTPLEPTYDDITKDTLGLIVYQEQIMQIFGRMAGYSATNIDRMRQKVAKKYGTEDFGKQRAVFIEGCGKNGIDAAMADALFDKMLHFGSYAFNKAHAYVYTQLAYWCMWLKVYHPRAFYIATLNHEGDDLEYRKTLEATVKQGIPVWLPDINLSQSLAIPEGEGIRLGLSRVKGIGDKTVAELTANQPYADMADLEERVNKRLVNVKVRGLIEDLHMFGGSRVHIDDAGQEWADKYPLPLGKRLQQTLYSLTDEQFPDFDFAPLADLRGRGGIGHIRGVMVNVILHQIGDFGDQKSQRWEIGRRYAIIDISDGTQTNRLKFDPDQYDRFQTLLRAGNMFVARVNKSARIDTMLFVQTIELIGGEEE
jgi:DNA polymerase-3 subunit alpha